MGLSMAASDEEKHAEHAPGGIVEAEEVDRPRQAPSLSWICGCVHWTEGGDRVWTS